MAGTHDALRAELEEAVRHLASFERPSASDGERRDRGWSPSACASHGCAARVEQERAHGGLLVADGACCATLAALAGRG